MSVSLLLSIKKTLLEFIVLKTSHILCFPLMKLDEKYVEPTGSLWLCLRAWFAEECRNAAHNVYKLHVRLSLTSAVFS